MSGLLVVFEGLDGAGTTTQVGLLREWLLGRDDSVHVTCEPSSGPVGRVLRQAIDGELSLDPVTMALAFASDRADHLRSLAPVDADWVLCDRYVLSSLAYQSGQGLDLAWLASVNAFARPADVTIFVDTPVGECLARIAQRGVGGLFHDQARLERTLAGYRAALAPGSPGAPFVGALISVDGSGSPQEVFVRIRAGIETFLAAETG